MEVGDIIYYARNRNGKPDVVSLTIRTIYEDRKILIGLDSKGIACVVPLDKAYSTAQAALDEFNLR